MCVIYTIKRIVIMKLPYICLMLLMFNYQYHKLFQVHVCQFIKKTVLV